MSAPFPNPASRPEEAIRRFSLSRDRIGMWKLAGVSYACACSFPDLATALDCARQASDAEAATIEMWVDGLYIGSVSACASWRIPVVMGYAPGCFRGMKRDAVPGMSINGGQASV